MLSRNIFETEDNSKYTDSYIESEDSFRNTAKIAPICQCAAHVSLFDMWAAAIHWRSFVVLLMSYWMSVVQVLQEKWEKGVY